MITMTKNSNLDFTDHSVKGFNKVYCNDNGKDTLYTEVQDIKDHTNLHFQCITDAINQEKDMTLHFEWIQQYSPKENIDTSIYSNLFTYPTLNEWIETICNLHNDKASGPSRIFYEMLKHLDRKN
ncbi:hypothetical protein GLOIN_2v1844221 [Rhizophagus clarus]|uniref:Uncharacterized protein n=1 Tax=Rhizophagus clarus TaxID=94130 RepID=A0A8H3LXL0_9GLOM|nr:hypothetical protein GLOIN_2v1844221 [Rhizophagus clarus]